MIFVCRRRTATWLLLAASVFASTSAPAQEKKGPPRMAPVPNPAKHVGENRRVLFKVAHSGRLEDGTYFLSSTRDADDPNGIWVTFTPEALRAYCMYSAASAEQITTHYLEASVRVDGTIVRRPAGQKGVSIVVADPEQLELQTVPAMNAGNRVGNYQRVRMTVNLAAPVDEGRMINLHSMKEWDNPKSFWVVLAPSAVTALRRLGISDPVAHLDGKTILVEGVITRTPEDEQKRSFASIYVDNPLQIEVVSEK